MKSRGLKSMTSAVDRIVEDDEMVVVVVGWIDMGRR